MPQKLFVIYGPIGVGKSSVCAELAAQLQDPASIVEPDAIKRMIDPNQSSCWRRETANSTAAFLVRQLLAQGRTTIVEAHAKYPDSIQNYAQIAAELDVPHVGVLLTATYDACLQRASARQVPDIAYNIDNTMIADYYCVQPAMPDDIVLDTTNVQPQQTAANILLLACLQPV